MSAIREMDHARTLSYRLLLSDPVTVTLPGRRHARSCILSMTVSAVPVSNQRRTKKCAILATKVATSTGCVTRMLGSRHEHTQGGGMAGADGRTDVTGRANHY